jgi:hypothetical protein
MVAVTRYRVTAKRWEFGWELHIDGVGVTQSATLASAGRMVWDYLAAVTGAEPGEIEVDYRIELDDELSAEIESARQASREAERLQREAAARWRAIARLLSKDRRMTGSDVAAVLNVSPQRVSQLLNP